MLGTPYLDPIEHFYKGIDVDLMYMYDLESFKWTHHATSQLTLPRLLTINYLLPANLSS